MRTRSGGELPGVRGLEAPAKTGPESEVEGAARDLAPSFSTVTEGPLAARQAGAATSHVHAFLLRRTGEAFAPIGERHLRDLDLDHDRKLGSGAHSAAFDLGGGWAAVVLEKAKRGEAIPAEVSEHLAAQADYMHRACQLSFEGHTVAPRVKARIIDSDGASVGFVMEKVPGRTLMALVDEGAISFGQLAEVRRQIEGQLAVLHQAGMIHGDANDRNILVHVDDAGAPTARLIDFEPPGRSFKAAEDAELLARTLNTAEAALAPEAVAARAAKANQRATEAARKERLIDAKSAHRELQRGLGRLLDGASPETQVSLEPIFALAALGGKESRLFTAELLETTGAQLYAEGAPDVLRAAGAPPELLRSLDRVFNWTR